MQDCTASDQLEAEVAGSGLMLGEQLMRYFFNFLGEKNDKRI
jgi:hypothetical protein